jgi:hypothetical protein
MARTIVSVWIRNSGSKRGELALFLWKLETVDPVRSWNQISIINDNNDKYLAASPSQNLGSNPL